jgi:MFS family permease
VADTGTSTTPRFGVSIVAATFATQGVAIGLSLGAYPVFLASLEAELGINRVQASAGIPLVLAAGALLSPWIGREVDRGSPRKIMFAGVALMVLGLVGIAASDHLALSVALWIGAVGAGHAMLGPIPAMTVLTKWFVARRSTMIAIAAMGTTAGGAVTPPLAEFLIQELGWRAALASLGALAGLIGAPVVWLGIIKRPEDIGRYPDGATEPPPPTPTQGEAASMTHFLRDPRYWLVGSAFALMNGVAISFITHIVAIAAERDISRQEAVLALTTNALCTAAGKIVFGVVTDRLGPRAAGQIATALQTVGWLGVISASDPLAFLTSAALFTFGLGCMIPCQAAFAAGIFGPEHFGRATGLIGLQTMTGALAIPIAVGVAYQHFGNYGLALQVATLGIALPFALFSAVRLPAGQAPRGTPAS